MTEAAFYDEHCRICPRLSAFLDTVKARHADYWCKPVPPFGDSDARMLIVGLAPGMHGANASGRPFTGDHAGILLYQMLHRYGFASRDYSESADDGLQLSGCRITNAVKCLPPDNKPVGAEINACNAYLERELAGLPARGRSCWRLAVSRTARSSRRAACARPTFKFAHHALHDLGDLRLLDSYHCSRYNTNTRRLTEEMFSEVFATARNILQQ